MVTKDHLHCRQVYNIFKVKMVIFFGTLVVYLYYIINKQKLLIYSPNQLFFSKFSAIWYCMYITW